MDNDHYPDSTERYRDDVLREADAICSDRHVNEVGSPRVLHVRGSLAAKRGLLPVAILCLTRAIGLRPFEADYYSTLGQVLHRSGRSKEAIAAHLRALTLAPLDADTWIRLGRALYLGGRLTEACAVYHEALRLRPAAPVALGELGDILLALGRLDEALECYEAMRRLDARRVDVWRRLGRLRLRRREPNQALALVQRGLEMHPDDADLQLLRGQSLIALNSPADAVDAFRAALVHRPHDISALRHFVSALELLGRTTDAVGAWVSLGGALQAAKQYLDASVSYRQALARKCDCLPALNGLGRVHLALGEPQQALRPLQQALAIDPGHVDAHIDLGHAFHLLGDDKRGWDEFVWYHYPHGTISRGFEQPIWDGGPLDGRTILLWTDRGRGDTIQFLRYAQFAKARNAHVIVECHHRGLIPLAERMKGVDRVVARHEPLPAFDVHAPLIYFPALLRTCRSAMPDAVPYLSADRALAEQWRQRLAPDGNRLIGISWSGNAAHISAHSRFMPLSAFTALSDLPGVRLVSLQYGPDAVELMTLRAGLHVERLFGKTFPIQDAAALIQNLDLVVTVDTMIAHLAGALGKPVWTLLRFASNWRWQLQGDATPWYPTMRLFRQPQTGDWATVMNRVRATIEAAAWNMCEQGGHNDPGRSSGPSPGRFVSQRVRGTAARGHQGRTRPFS